MYPVYYNADPYKNGTIPTESKYYVDIDVIEDILMHN